MTVEDVKKTHKKLLKFVCTVEYIMNKRLCEIKANKYSQSSRKFSKPDCVLSESIDIPHIIEIFSSPVKWSQLLLFVKVSSPFK